MQVADFINKFRCQKIHRQLYTKVNGYQKSDGTQSDVVLALKRQKQQRYKVIDYRLRNISDIGGINRMSVIIFYLLSHFP